MTCKDKFYEDPNHIGYDHRNFCPRDCGYLPNPEYCKEGADENVVCEMCWLRELPNEEKKTCAPNYEAMYNDMVLKVESQKDDIKQLKTENGILEHKLACAKGAIAMVEVIYGRQWAPSKLEMIR